MDDRVEARPEPVAQEGHFSMCGPLSAQSVWVAAQGRVCRLESPWGVGVAPVAIRYRPIRAVLALTPASESS